MDLFIENIYKIYEFINSEDESKSIVKTKILSKQYLSYYLYRIVAKYLNIINMGTSSSDINELMKLLRIPQEHKLTLSYPIVGKMTNDNEILDMIILRALDLLDKTNKYVQSIKASNAYSDFLVFFKTKDFNTILNDIIDLQKLIPGLSVPAIRPNYLNNDNKL